jgi:hypothetical protein
VHRTHNNDENEQHHQQYHEGFGFFSLRLVHDLKFNPQALE